MFFKKKKKDEPVQQPVEAKPPILSLDRIVIGQTAGEKEDVIRQIGQMLVDAGCVEEEYKDAMVLREKTMSTYLGNGLAIPHGVDEAKERILHSGLAIMVFPEGTPWPDTSAGSNDGVAKVVIGIAGQGDEHLDLLAKIAETFCDEEAVQNFIALDEQGIYDVLTAE